MRDTAPGAGEPGPPESPAVAPSDSAPPQRSRRPLPAAVTERLRSGARTRILAFGSSNTEHFLPGMHWLEVLDLALRATYGRVHCCINAGVGGHTSRDLLERFARDAAFYLPHVALITIGGNDANPGKGISAEQFHGNLRDLHRRFTEMGCLVVFQTYYSPDPTRAGDLSAFHRAMDQVRTVADETAAGLIDHLARWEPFRLAFPQRYLRLMHDGFHLNRHGNKVMGLDIARAFAARVPPDPEGYWDEALDIQAGMDALAGHGTALPAS